MIIQYSTMQILPMQQDYKSYDRRATPGQTISRAEKTRGFFDAACAAGLGEGAHGASVLGGSASSEYGDSEMADVGHLLAARIATDANRPTGVVAMNDMLAFGLMADLTTVRLPVPDMARTIVERVFTRMADPSLAPGEFLFAPSLVQRESVAAAAARAWL